VICDLGEEENSARSATLKIVIDFGGALGRPRDALGTTPDIPAERGIMSAKLCRRRGEGLGRRSAWSVWLARLLLVGSYNHYHRNHHANPSG
jgi:hypothetical protein